MARLWAGLGSIFNLLVLAPPADPGTTPSGRRCAGWKSLGDVTRQHGKRVRRIAAADLGVSEGDLAEAHSVVQGFARDAEVVVPGGPPGSHSPMSAKRRSSRRWPAAYRRAGGRADAAVARQVANKAGIFTRLTIETLFIALAVCLLFVLGRNFFYDAPWLGKPLLGLEFLIYSAFWVVAWGWLLHWLLMRRLYRGLRREIAELVDALPAETITGSLYRDLEEACDRVQAHASRSSTRLPAILPDSARSSAIAIILGVGQLRGRITRALRRLRKSVPSPRRERARVRADRWFIRSPSPLPPGEGQGEGKSLILFFVSALTLTPNPDGRWEFLKRRLSSDFRAPGPPRASS